MFQNGIDSLPRWEKLHEYNLSRLRNKDEALNILCMFHTGQNYRHIIFICFFEYFIKLLLANANDGAIIYTVKINHLITALKVVSFKR